MMKLFLLSIFLFVVACGVSKKSVIDKPPEYVEANAMSGRLLGHIVINDNIKKEVGGSFFAFQFPPEAKTGERSSENYFRLVSFMRKISLLLEPVTETQFQDRTVYNKFSSACKFENEEELEIEKSSSQVNCSKINSLEELNVEYSNCGLDPFSDEDVEPSKNQCDCLASNRKKTFDFMKRLNVDETDLLLKKKAFATCAWRKIDPNEGQSLYWLFGDDKKADGSLDELTEYGSRISLVKGEKEGEIKAIIDLMNFNGVNYTTESRDYMGPWGKIENVEYDKTKHRLFFDLIEQQKDSGLTGRIIAFELERSVPFRSSPNFHRFAGTVRFKEDGKETGLGQAKFDGYVQEKLEKDMEDMWLDEGIIKPDKKQ